MSSCHASKIVPAAIYWPKFNNEIAEKYVKSDQSQ